MEGAIHIIYFLNWMNQVEHPHLLQVNHSTHSSIHLRDVKRWLSDRRGKEMPDLFAWSCKRKYKMGYVWQDLVDDDVIPPISGHELVLKGSLISSPATDSSPTFQRLEQLQQSLGEIRGIDSSIAMNADLIPKRTSTPYHAQCKPLNFTPVSHHWDKHYSMKRVSEIEEVIDDVKHHSSSSSIASSSTLRNDIIERDDLFATSPSPPYLSPKKKSHSSGTSNSLLNLLSCGVIETNNSTISKNSTAHFVDFHKRRQHHNWGSCFDGMRSLKESSELPGCKLRLKPALEPNCSQCGESFKPEKMQKHMKTCRGLKKQGKANSIAASIAEKLSIEIGFT